MAWTKEQEKAIELDGTNIIVSAGAGSGKTAVLSERVIHKLKKGINVDELLILTFTNAAASEMLNRIEKKIKQNNLIKQLDRLGNAYITTFDSFALSIVKKYNYLINVDKNISIISNSVINLKKQEILDEIFDELYKEKNSKFLKLIDSFCSRDDQNIKSAVLNISKKLDMIYNEENYLKEYLDIYFSDDFIDKKVHEYEELILNRISIINNTLIEIEEYVDNDYYIKLQESLENLINCKNYNDIKSLNIKLPTLPKNSSDEVKSLKEKISNTIKEINNLTDYENIDEIKNLIYESKDYVSSLIDIILKLDIEVKKYKFDNDLYEFSDIAKMAISIVENNELVRLELKNQFKEIMIDEYQDTNDLQDLFISFIENNNVYMVGDIKQSIYRFRNANPNLFKTKYDAYSKHINGEKIDLNKNFRSRKEVITCLNEIFNKVMSDTMGGADYENVHQMIFGNEDYEIIGKVEHSNDLEILKYEYDKDRKYKKEEIEIFIIANDIKEKIDNNYEIYDKDNKIKRPLKYSDIVILMDRTTNFNLYKKIFEYLNIPMSIYKDESITDSIDISIIKHLVNLVINKENNKNFKYSFISVLRSYLFNMDDNEIFKYFVNENYNESLLIKKINEIKITSLSESLENIINTFDFYEKIISVGDINKHIKTIDYLINEAKNLEKMGYTLCDFYNYLDNILENSLDIKVSGEKEDNGVKIMTIHKSKGLEYHLCYYSGLYQTFNTQDIKDNFLFDKEYGIITPIVSNGIRSLIYKDLLKNKYLKEELSEKIRLLYVALTRAKEKMIMICPISDKKYEYHSLLDIINSVNLDKYSRIIDLNNISITHNYNLVKQTNYDEILNDLEEKIEVNEINIEQNIIEQEHFSKKNHNLIDNDILNNINYGKRIHSIFENIDFFNPDYSELNDYEKDLVNSFLNTKILENVINVYKEYEFLYNKNNINYHGIIDLLLEFENEYKIVDYKLKNITDEAYLEQLNGYKNYIEYITGKKTSIYLYSIIDKVLTKM